MYIQVHLPEEVRKMTKTAVIIGGGISGIFVMKDLQEKSIATKVTSR